MDHHVTSSNTGTGSIIEDQRALQLALELSMLGLTTVESVSSSNSSSLMTSARIGSPLSPSFSFLNNHGGLLDNSSFSSTLIGDDHHNNLLTSSSFDESFRSAFGGGYVPKKSQNMTECVPVPSSEHVAEIVGRQGCKIKALRAKTNTYIKTPVRGEEPVFVVTGRKEDVAQAKREILSAADHFTQIRASRKGGCSSGLGSPSDGGSLSPTCAPTAIPGQITIQVRVPYRVVGLVVGPKGATIKRIQQQTHTYIVTPSRDKDPVFEVTGLPDSVQMAKREIEAHIAIRTGSLPLDNNAIGDELTSSQTELLANLYKNGLQDLEQLSIGLGLGLGLGALSSLSTSLSSVSSLGTTEPKQGNTVGSSSSGGSSLSSLNGFNVNAQKDNYSSFCDYSSILGVSGLGLATVEPNDNSSSGGGSFSSLSSITGFNEWI